MPVQRGMRYAGVRVHACGVDVCVGDSGVEQQLRKKTEPTRKADPVTFAGTVAHLHFEWCGERGGRQHHLR
jgi:hypothetical protein